MATPATASTPAAPTNELARVDASRFVLWPAEDMFRLVCLLQACGAASLLTACTTLCRQLGAPAALLRKAELAEAAREPGGAAVHEEALEAQQALGALELALARASAPSEGVSASTLTPTWESSWQNLLELETALKTEMRYIYGPDWEVKPGKLVSKKGTWLKSTTKFSWEVAENDKFYMPHGIVMPVLQIARVVDAEELHRHEWTVQHLRVWLKPSIIQTLETRRGGWFIYRPHWEETNSGLTIVALADTWLKRSCQMSGELQPFELIYVPKGLPLALSSPPEVVSEQWEKFRHAHVHQHRKVALAAPPRTLKQDKYDILFGQSDDSVLPHPVLAKRGGSLAGASGVASGSGSGGAGVSAAALRTSID